MTLFVATNTQICAEASEATLISRGGNAARRGWINLRRERGEKVREAAEGERAEGDSGGGGGGGSAVEYAAMFAGS